MSSPWPRERISVLQRRQGRPVRSKTQFSSRPPPPAERRISGCRPRTTASTCSSLTRASAPPGVDARQEAALRLPHVPDPGQVALVEQGIADAARLIVLAQADQEAPLVEIVADQVRPQRGDALVEARARVGHQLEHGAVELHDLVLARAQHEPGASRRAPPALSAPVDVPAAAHAQVRVERELALEADEEMLPARIDGAHRTAAQPLRPAVERVARLRGLDLLDLTADERRSDAPRRRVNRVALGHLSQTRWPACAPAAST